jgi:hypothetical protein
MRICTLFLFIVAFLLLHGCVSLPKPGFPNQSLDDTALIKSLESACDLATMIDEYYNEADARQAKRIRDKIVNIQLTIIDLHYVRFIQRASLTKQSLDTASDVTTLGLNLAIPLAAGESAKAVLGAIAAGITGSNLAVSKNFFYETTLPVILTHMNASRKEARIPILEGIRQSTDIYPLANALINLRNYYLAGTFPGALQSIQVDAGAKDKRAQETIHRVTHARYATTDRDLRNRINAWMQDTNQGKQLQTWIRETHPGYRGAAPTWVDDAAVSPTQLQEAIDHFQIPEQREEP